MAPDINTLPTAGRGSMDENSSDASPRAPSLAAAATINAGMQSQESRRSSTSSSSRSRLDRSHPSNPTNPSNGQQERRRSAVMMNLNLNDPSLPGPGELQANDPRSTTGRTASPGSHGSSPFSPATADPHHHHRMPSLGELHQELEQEQEAQVNRLLFTIRQQQSQLQQLQQTTGQPVTDFTGPAVEDSSPGLERSGSLSGPATGPTSAAVNPHPRSPIAHGRRGSYGLSRQSSSRSRTQSRGDSPALRPVSANLGGPTEITELPRSTSVSSRDETTFYQAEAQSLTRENQMLKQRIRELERQLSENSTSPNAPIPTVQSQMPSSVHSRAAASEASSTTQPP